MKKKELIKKINELKTSRIDMRDTYISQGNYGVAATVDGYVGGLDAVLNLFKEEDEESVFDWENMPKYIKYAWLESDGMAWGSSQLAIPILTENCFSALREMKHILPNSLVLQKYTDWQDSLEQRPSRTTK